MLRVEKKSGVAVVLYDVARAELAADLTAADDLSATALHRLLIEQGVQGPKGQPWATSEFAAHMHVSVKHVRYLLDTGMVGSIKVGKRKRLIPDHEARLCFGVATAEQIREGIRRLARAAKTLDELQYHGKRRPAAV